MATILIVDDEQPVRKVLTRYLEEAGHTCQAAPSVRDAREALTNRDLDLILSDVNMPEESGIDLARHVAAHHPDIPMIMVSVMDDPDFAKTALDLGAYGYIVKPFTRNIVLINVENALQRRRLEIEKRAYLNRLETSVRQRTKSLSNQLTFLQDLIDAIPSPIFYKDKNEKFKGCNRAFEEMTGLTRDAIIGKTPFDVVPEDLAAISTKTHQGMFHSPGTVITYEYDMVYPDQTVHNLLVNKATYRNGDGNPAGQVGVMVDITEKVQMERELRQAQKLESIGQLAAGIAHEINTPTQYISDNSRFIQEATTELLNILKTYDNLLSAAKAGAPLGDHITEVEKKCESADLAYLQEEIPLAIEQTREGVSRVSKIVNSMRQFSHPGTGKKTPVDLNKALEATINVARNEWKYVADVETDFDPRMPPVSCLAGEINQVFLNLLINASHAIGDVCEDGKNGKGIISITTSRNNGWAMVTIADTGPGIPEEIQQRIYDPFFTTKSVGKGTGQGLAIAHRVINERHQGSISFETGEGQGTTFIVKLPLNTPENNETTTSEVNHEDHAR